MSHHYFLQCRTPLRNIWRISRQKIYHSISLKRYSLTIWRRKTCPGHLPRLGCCPVSSSMSIMGLVNNWTAAEAWLFQEYQALEASKVLQYIGEEPESNNDLKKPLKHEVTRALLPWTSSLIILCWVLLWKSWQRLRSADLILTLHFFCYIEAWVEVVSDINTRSAILFPDIKLDRL